MLAPKEMKARLTQVFNEPQATVLTDVIHSSYRDLVHSDDFNELKEIVRDLAAAQQRTELRVEELAAAQQRTENVVERLDRSMQKLSRQVGGLSDRLGGDLEDVAYIVVHDVLGRELGWRVQPLSRSTQKWNGAEQEIDLFGQAHDPARPGLPIWIVGEVKFNLTMKEVLSVSPAKWQKRTEIFRARSFQSASAIAHAPKCNRRCRPRACAWSSPTGG